MVTPNWHICNNWMDRAYKTSSTETKKSKAQIFRVAVNYAWTGCPRLHSLGKEYWRYINRFDFFFVFFSFLCVCVGGGGGGGC